LTELDALGETPLPPYIERSGEQAADRERYQTIYARAAGSVAAPTAGLHFTPDLLERIRARGARVCFVTLHVGLGTFAPVKAERLEDHVMHEERFALSADTANAIGHAKKSGHRVVAGGTTTLRVLESATQPGEGRTRIFIHPPHQFKTADALLTNFHLPRSTLLMLAAAFAAPGETRGRDLILRAYEEAVAQRYRFFSYGDAMLIL
jgi:S-adenosylmethionine:tRNA ribosyltransferase-isomerase